MSDDLVLISGAAGGIGRATISAFVEAGYRVGGLDVAPEVAEASTSAAYEGRVADVREPEALARAVAELAPGGALRHVIGLAGGTLDGEAGLLERSPTEATAVFADSVAVNLCGQFNLIRCSTEALGRASGDRSIALCSSINALGDFGAPAYSAAKAGLTGLMHACAAELGRAGIRVNVVAPGTVTTSRTAADAGRVGHRRRARRFAAETHLGRVAGPEDVASSLLALAERMPHVSDQVIAVDGGQLRHRRR